MTSTVATDGLFTVLPRVSKRLLLMCLCMHSDSNNSIKQIQQKEHGGVLLLLFPRCMFFFFSPNNLFLHYVLILSQIDPKCFCLWGKQTEKWELQEEKNDSSRFFKVPWQQNTQKNSDEDSRQGEADYQGDNLLLQLTEQQSLIAHKHTRVVFFKSGPMCKNSLFSVLSWSFSLRMNERGYSIKLWRWRSLGCCCSKASLAVKALASWCEVDASLIGSAAGWAPDMQWARTLFFLP